MKVVEINMVSNGSTGRIMLQIAECAKKEGIDVITFSTHPASKLYSKQIAPSSTHRHFGTFIENNVHFVIGYLTGYNGCFSWFSTYRFVRILKKINPDIIHLHNLHASYLNMPMLFRYIKTSNVQVIWTLHDCWSFTGQCPHFTVAKCERWKTGCHHCPQYRRYPATYVDRTQTMWKLKKKWFTTINSMVIVTPSQWLANLVKQSYLKDYHVEVINNGIDLNVFKPTPSEFRKVYKVPEYKHILLGVAFGWGIRKGLDVFLELYKRLDGEKYQIVLVGTDENVDKQLPDDVISIHCTNNQQELAEIYTAADLFVNPTREEVLGLVNIEANACGTPVITFNTGGSPECIDETSGSVVGCDDINAMEREIMRICTEKPYSLDACLKRAKAFDMNDKFKEYVKLYEQKQN